MQVSCTSFILNHENGHGRQHVAASFEGSDQFLVAQSTHKLEFPFQRTSNSKLCPAPFEPSGGCRWLGLPFRIWVVDEYGWHRHHQVLSVSVSLQVMSHEIVMRLQAITTYNPNQLLHTENIRKHTGYNPQYTRPTGHMTQTKNRCPLSDFSGVLRDLFLPNATLQTWVKWILAPLGAISPEDRRNLATSELEIRWIKLVYVKLFEYKLD